MAEPKKDIAAETLKVGNALASVRLDTMITNLALGIAQGQFQLDKEGVNITKMMGAPNMVTIGGEQMSMLEAGFVPSFYHFVDTILELKMEVKIREEINSSTKTKETSSRSGSFTAKAGLPWASATVSGTAAYSKTVDTEQSQKYSQELTAQSLMRTKLVPIPAPEVLVERIKDLLKKKREQEASGEEEDADAIAEKLAAGDALAEKYLKEAFAGVVTE